MESDLNYSSMGRVGGTQTDRKPSQLDHIRENAERAAARTAAIRNRLEESVERLTGPTPRNAGGAVGEAISASGFIGGAGTALDRLHGELTSIDDLIQRLSELI